MDTRDKQEKVLEVFERLENELKHAKNELIEMLKEEVTEHSDPEPYAREYMDK